MSLDEQTERDRALRVAMIVQHYNPWDAARDLALILSHVEEARQDALAFIDWAAATDRLRAKLNNPPARRDPAETPPVFHDTAECDMCRRAAIWLPLLNGMLR